MRTEVDPYFSRRGDCETIVERRDPVVWGDQAGPLSEKELARYRDLGFLVLPNVFEAGEAERLKNEADRLSLRHDEESAARARIPEPDADDVRSVFQAHKTTPAFAALVDAPRLRDRARQILGGEVYVHQFRINYKPAFGGREFQWHSDFETWHVEDGMPRMRAVSAVVMLESNNSFNGPLLVIPGSHRRYVRCAGDTPEEHFKSSLRRQEYGVPSTDALRKLAFERGLAGATGEPGTVTLFDCNLMHASAGNLSPYSRTNAFIVYNSTDNALVEPFGGRRPRPGFLGERHAPA